MLALGVIAGTAAAFLVSEYLFAGTLVHRGLPGFIPFSNSLFRIVLFSLSFALALSVLGWRMKMALSPLAWAPLLVAGVVAWADMRYLAFLRRSLDARWFADWFVGHAVRDLLTECALASLLTVLACIAVSRRNMRDTFVLGAVTFLLNLGGSFVAAPWVFAGRLEMSSFIDVLSRQHYTAVHTLPEAWHRAYVVVAFSVAIRWFLHGQKPPAHSARAGTQLAARLKRRPVGRFP